MAVQVSSKTDLSPKMRKLREDALASLHVFNSEVMRFSKEIYGLSAPMHKEMDEWGEAVFTDPRRYHLMLDFRGSGKSVKIGAGHTLWRCMRNPNIQVRYMHADEDTASNLYSQIRGALEGGAILRELFAKEIFQVDMDDPSKTKLVIDNDGFTLNRSFAPKTPTFKLLGYKSGKIGAHVDLFVLDDLVNEKTTQSALLMESVRHFVRLLPPLLKHPIHSRVVLLGTRWDQQDAYGMLMEDKAYAGNTRSWVKSCYADAEESVSRWPDKFSVETLQAMEVEMTPRFFSANMRNEPMPRGMALFDVSKVKRYTLELDANNRPRLPSELPYLIYTAIDPNRTENGDPGAVLTVARDADDNHFVLDLEHGKPPSTELVQWIRMAWQRWRAMVVLYEGICGQAMLIPWLKQDMLQTGIVYPLQESNRRQTVTSKRVRIRALSQIIETGKLWVPNSTRFRPLMKEIEHYTDAVKEPRDDCLDCLSDIFLDGFRPAGGSHQKKSNRAQDVGLPWQTGLIDGMIAHTWGAPRPRVVSVESQAYRGR